MKNANYNSKVPWAMIAIAFFSISACKEVPKKENNIAENQKETLEIAHKLDTVQVEKEPKKVVALNYAALENLDRLGIPIVGMPKSHVPQYLKKYSDDNSVVDLGTIFEVDYEKLSELDPDVIFISPRMLKNHKELSKIGPTIYTDSERGNELISFKRNIQLFGTLFNKEEAVENIITKIEDSIEKLRDTVKASGKNALIVIHNNGKFSAFGKASRFGIIHNLLGFKEAHDGLDIARHGQAVSNEFIQKVNPDYLFIIDRSAVVNKSATNKEAIENVMIRQTQAYKNGNIVYLSPEAWYLSGDGVTSFEIMIQEVKDNL